MSNAYRDGIIAAQSEPRGEADPREQETLRLFMEALGYGKEVGPRDHIDLPSQTGARLGIAQSDKHMPSQSTLAKLARSIATGADDGASASKCGTYTFAGHRMVDDVFYPETGTLDQVEKMIDASNRPSNAQMATEIARIAEQHPADKLEAAVLAYLDEVLR